MGEKGVESARDYDYMTVSAPTSSEPTLQQKLGKEWKARWWLWSVVIFAVVVCGGLLAFRGSLYTENAGLPLLAVTENAQEVCELKCSDQVGVDGEGNPKNKEKYEGCIASCVKGETEQVAEERKDFAEEQKKEAEEEEKKEEETEKKDETEPEKKDEKEPETEVKADGDNVRKLLWFQPKSLVDV